MKRICRRRFLNLSAVGASGLIIGRAAGKAHSAPLKALAGASWVDGLQINPAIPNTRAVIIDDPAMLIHTVPANWQIQNVNEAVNTERVAGNMDKMAVALARPPSGEASDAWRIIFQKPEGKEWGAVTAALKTNFLDPANSPRLAVFEKLCIELMTLGIPAESITIYDGTLGDTGAVPANQQTAPYSDPYSRARLPQGIHTERWECVNSPHLIELPQPDGTSAPLVTGIAEGRADILINVFVNKGHGLQSFTLSMKNHLGSMIGHHFDFGHLPITEFMVPFAHRLAAIGKSAGILGTGTVPRQQLVVGDLLWSNTDGPFGNPDVITSKLAMGTFGPIIDYLVVRAVRDNPEFSALLKDASNPDVYRVFLQDFGYDPDDPDISDLAFVDAAAYPTSAAAKRPAPALIVNLFLPGRAEPVNFSIPAFDGRPEASVFGLSGGAIRSLGMGHRGHDGCFDFQWDGKSESGHFVSSGIYVLKIGVSSRTAVRKFRL